MNCHGFVVYRSVSATNHERFNSVDPWPTRSPGRQPTSKPIKRQLDVMMAKALAARADRSVFVTDDPWPTRSAAVLTKSID